MECEMFMSAFMHLATGEIDKQSELLKFIAYYLSNNDVGLHVCTNGMQYAVKVQTSLAPLS